MSEEFPRNDIPSSANSNESVEYEVDIALDAAIDAGLDSALLPPKGTEAHRRLCSLAKEYSKEVHLEMMDRAHADSGSVRRTLHNELCIMLFGKTHDDAGPDKVRQARNFAHLISGRDQYVD